MRFLVLALLKSALGWPMGNSTLTDPSHGRVTLEQRKQRNLEVLVPGQTDSLLDWTAVLLGVPTASVTLESSSGVTGTINIEQWGDHVRIHGRVFGLSAGLHGIHVHAVGDTGDNCLAAGGHFNPDAVEHGARCGVHLSPTFPYLPTIITSCDEKESHAGDLGNLKVTVFGEARIDIADTSLTLGDGGARDIADRSIVIHAGTDDLGLGTGAVEEGSKATGNAGGRVACGVIQLQGEKEE